jgi:sugar-specific transcriptional regulator TrmB
MNYEDILIKSGLTNDQAVIYGTLLKNGVLPAQKVALKAGIKRGLCYKVIDQLVEKGLIEKIDKKVALFSPAHPSKLKEIIEKQAQELKSISDGLSTELGRMTSDYNMFLGKPNVRFFEGEEGVKKVLEDTLYTTEEILSYADITAIQKYVPKLNAWYGEKRVQKNIKKRGILLDTPEARKILESYHAKITDSRLMSIKSAPFQSLMNIYDNKISYVTFSNNQMIGVIIEDPAIYLMHKTLFEFSWLQAKEM